MRKFQKVAKESPLKQYFNLEHQVKVYIPSTVDVDTKVDTREYVKLAIKTLSDLFGGATATEALGGWTTKQGEVVTEKVTIVSSYCKKEQLEDGGLESVLKLAKKVKNELKQEAVSLEYDNKLYLI